MPPQTRMGAEIARSLEVPGILSGSAMGNGPPRGKKRLARTWEDHEVLIPNSKLLLGRWPLGVAHAMIVRAPKSTKWFRRYV